MPAGRVDRRGAFEGSPDLLQNAFQTNWIMGEKISNILGTLLEVAGFTGQGEIGDPVRSPFRPRTNVFQLERYVRRATIGALSCPFLQAILAHFLSEKLPLLVCYASNFRVLHLLQVETDQFLGERAHVRDVLILFIQVRMFSTREQSDGGNHPFFRLR